MDVQEFVDEFCIQISAKKIPNDPKDTWLAGGGTTWKCKLTSPLFSGKMKTKFKMGSANHHEPTAAQLLECLHCSICSYLLYADDMGGFLTEMGFSDEEPMTGMDVYKNLKKLNKKLTAWMGFFLNDFLELEN